MIPFFLIFLPLGVVLVAWIFGKANLVGMFVACILHLAVVVGLISWMTVSDSLLVTYVAAMLGLVSMLGIPWAGALISTSLPVQGPAPAKQVADAYNALSPEEKQMAKEAGMKVFKGLLAGVGVFLRRKGHHGLASATEQFFK